MHPFLSILPRWICWQLGHSVLTVRVEPSLLLESSSRRGLGKLECFCKELDGEHPIIYPGDLSAGRFSQGTFHGNLIYIDLDLCLMFACYIRP